MVFTRKFSQFAVGGELVTNDEPVGLRSGVNTIFTFTGSGSGGGATTATIIQPDGGPTLSLGQWVRVNVNGIDANPGAYVPALATNAHLGEVIGVVIAIVSANQYTIQQAGYIQNTSSLFGTLNAGSPYYLDVSTPGNMVPTDVSASGLDSRPVFVADSANSGWVVPYRGFISNGLGAVEGGPGVDSNIHKITQANNGFDIGQWVYVSGENIYSLAQANSLAAAQAIGVVISSGNPEFIVQFGGWNSNTVTSAVDASGNALAIVASTVYYLSDVVAGAITPTPGAVSKPVYISESANNITGWILPQRPLSGSLPINSPSIVTVNQPGNVFDVGDVIYVSGENSYDLAVANDTFPVSNAIGVVIIAGDPNFTYQTEGNIVGVIVEDDVGNAIVAGTQYWLSNINPGKVTAIVPNIDTQYSVPLYQPYSSSSGIITRQRSLLLPFGGGPTPEPPPVVVPTAFTGVYATTTSGWETVFCSTITPSGSTDGIWIVATVEGGGAGNGQPVYFRLTRNGTPIFLGNAAAGRTLVSGAVGHHHSVETTSWNANFIDYPNSTNPVVYCVQMISPGGAACYVNRSSVDGNSAIYNRSSSSLILVDVPV